jgi:hypothetical protein
MSMTFGPLTLTEITRFLRSRILSLNGSFAKSTRALKPIRGEIENRELTARPRPRASKLLRAERGNAYNRANLEQGGVTYRPKNRSRASLRNTVPIETGLKHMSIMLRFLTAELIQASRDSKLTTS